MPAPVTSADRWLVRSHALLGVALLGGFLIYHLLQLWPVLDSREAWVAAAAQRGSSSLLAIGVLVVLVVHGVLGAMRIARSKAAQLTRDERGLRTIQAVSGVLIAAFVVYHLAHLWGHDADPHGSARATYDVLWSSLGRPLQMSVYLLGVSLACFHFAHGLSRVALGFGEQPPSAARGLLVRVLAGAFGFGLWALWLQVLAHFVIGQRLF
jgi:succinate dehydrogenase / fumarate reductase cytochrome b subunit